MLKCTLVVVTFSQLGITFELWLQVFSFFRFNKLYFSWFNLLVAVALFSHFNQCSFILTDVILKDLSKELEPSSCLLSITYGRS